MGNRLEDKQPSEYAGKKYKGPFSIVPAEEPVENKGLIYMDGVKTPAISPTVEPTLPKGVQHDISETREKAANSESGEEQKPPKRSFDTVDK